MTQNSDLLQNRKKACSSIPSATATMQKLSHLSLCILLGLTTLTAQANTTGAEEYRGSAAVDTSAPIAALSKLTSLDDDKPLTVTIPTIQQFKTKAGVPVRFVQTTALPIVDIDLRFNAGSARDGSISSTGFGIANMTATMLTQGSKRLDENEFTRAVETLGINLNSSAYKDMFIVSLRSLSDDKHLLPAVDLMTQMLSEPAFDDSILARNKARLLVGLQQQKQDPNSLASIAFSEALYGEHPYAHPSAGTLESVPTIEKQQLIDFKNRYLVAANASVAITGNLTLEQAKKLAEDITSKLPKGQPATELPEPKPLSQAKHIHIPFPSTQTTVLMGQLGDKRATDPQSQQKQTNFAVGNEVLAGGDFNARLMTEIRQNLGYTYGISGSMNPMLARGPYQIGFSTRNDKARAAIDASLAVINDTLEKGITSTEMRLTTDNLKNSFPMGFASNAGINGLLGMMNFYQLPNSYLTDYVKRVDQVKLSEVNQTMQDTLKPDDFLIVTVGQEDPWKDKKTNK
ncbi:MULTISPECIES: M16 family metallopeptidase [unclassified Psychrobacter]|uniref:M16 family metallopeptidase n=1 Tax=unclassified Psychrobacter TaxID=196806 RepID=UPI000EE53264|nr:MULTISPECIES: pitrilysin family protein [unclassified Psychrobacter]MBE8608885.1 insulinase family protein [Pseudomonas lundensis]HCI76979.1 insulinase family protein [Psychrobacter sp.]